MYSSFQLFLYQLDLSSTQSGPVNPLWGDGDGSPSRTIFNTHWGTGCLKYYDQKNSSIKTNNNFLTVLAIDAWACWTNNKYEYWRNVTGLIVFSFEFMLFKVKILFCYIDFFSIKCAYNFFVLSRIFVRFTYKYLQVPTNILSRYEFYGDGYNLKLII